MQCLERTAKLAQMLKRLFPPPERSPDVEHQGKNDGYAQKGQVYIIGQVILESQIEYDTCDEQGDVGPFIDR